MPEDQRRIGAAEAETVAEGDAHIHVVAALAEDGHVGEGRIEVVDVGAFAEEAVLHHEDAIDRFLDAGGAGVVVLEELEHAKARGARIYGEIVGYGATSDGYDMVAPSGEGAVRCMRMALQGVTAKVDYINPHGTSTPVGDSKEMEGVRAVFGDDMPMISSTKSLTGHSLGAAGAQEAIYCLLMMQAGFAAESAHIENLDPEFEGMPILRERHDGELTHVMSNSFGFGGTNGTLILSKV